MLLAWQQCCTQLECKRGFGGGNSSRFRHALLNEWDLLSITFI